MDATVRPRDRRRDTFFQIAASVLASDVALIAWLASGNRGFVDGALAWLIGLYLGLFGWILLGERRRPRLRWPIRRTSWDGDPDRLAGVLIVLVFGALNLTWRSWLPGHELAAGIPDSRLPGALFVLQLGLTVILASLSTLAILLARRLKVRLAADAAFRALAADGSTTPAPAPALAEPPLPRVQVRDAVADDAGAIRAIAVAAWRDTYADLLAERTIDAFLDHAYPEDRLVGRIERHTFLVTEERGTIVAFADAIVQADRLTLVAIYARPDRQRNGAGSLLLAALRSRFPDRPIDARVLVGNVAGEGFYAALGFEPRETIDEDLFGEAVVERGWVLEPSSGR